ncbi:MAG: Yip1 family protein [Pseudomonadota bacterium]
MTLFSRAKRLLLQPRAEWRRIDEEPVSAAQVVRRTLLPLAAVPALGAAVGLCLVGAGGGAPAQRLPWATGAVLAAALYLLMVVGLLLVALVAATVAPTFGGRGPRTNALKLAVHGSTAALLGGIFLVLPVLAPLSLLAALYSVYLVFTGLPVLMRNPPQRSVPYTAVVVLAGAVVGLLASSTMAHFGLARGLPLDTARLEAASRQVTDAAQRLEAASEKQGAAPAAGQPPLVGTAPVSGGDPDGAVVPAPALKAALPAALGAFTRTAIEMQGGQVTGKVASNARADYTNGEQRLRVELLDLGTMSKLMSEAGAVVQGERDNAAESERTWQEAGRTLHENYRKDGSMAQYTTTLRNGVVVELTGTRMNLDEVKAASSQLDLATLEGLQRRKLP